MLPLGLRVQEKLEVLIDTHMRSLGASKVSLSNLSSQSLWHKSGRLNKDSELFRLEDRKGAKYLLAPTHEEEITSLVGGIVKSYRDLPLRLYQITRKYRDEPRPRQGLLRGREFVMKDLYTFDATAEAALDTYALVKQAYIRIFSALKIPYMIAAADSGSIGGDFSHEFHIPSTKGEDTVISCTSSSCGHTWNEELSTGQHFHGTISSEGAHVLDREPAEFGTHEAEAISTDLWMGISADASTLVRAFYPRYLMPEHESEPQQREPNTHAIKAICQSLNIHLKPGISNALQKWQAQLLEGDGSGNTTRVVDIYDHRVRRYDRPPSAGLMPGDTATQHNQVEHTLVDEHPDTQAPLDCIKPLPGDTCPKCGLKSLKTHKTIELGHTFYLGTKYSSLLGAQVTLDNAKLKGEALVPQTKATRAVPLQMGCHGIGVSRMISAIADALSDSKGLNWPRAVAPFEVVIVADQSLAQEAEHIYDSLIARHLEHDSRTDAIIDDRDKSLVWRLRDADLVGYPVIIILGKSWKATRKVEVQCRRLEGLRQEVTLEELPAYVRSLLAKL